MNTRASNTTAPNIHKNASTRVNVTPEYVVEGFSPRSTAVTTAVWALRGKNLTLDLASGMTGNSRCGTNAAANGSRTALAIASTHTAWRVEAEARRKSPQSNAAPKRMMLALAM